MALTESDKMYILDNCEKMSISAIAKNIHRGRSSISSFINESKKGKQVKNPVEICSRCIYFHESSSRCMITGLKLKNYEPSMSCKYRIIIKYD